MNNFGRLFPQGKGREMRVSHMEAQTLVFEIGVKPLFSAKLTESRVAGRN